VTYYLIVEIVVNFYVGSYDKANMVTVYGNSECVWLQNQYLAFGLSSSGNHVYVTVSIDVRAHFVIIDRH